MINISGLSKQSNEVILKFCEPNYAHKLEEYRHELYQLIQISHSYISTLEEYKNQIAYIIIKCGNILRYIKDVNEENRDIIATITKNYQHSVVNLDLLEQSLCEIKVRKLVHNISNNLGVDENLRDITLLYNQAVNYGLHSYRLRIIDQYIQQQVRILSN